MLIEIQTEVFNNEANFEKFTFLLRIFSYRHRYLFFVDISRISETNLFKNLTQIDRLILEEYFNRQITFSQKPHYFVGENSADKNCYQIDEAIRFFNQKVYLILENSLSDGYFLDSLITNFKGKGKSIRRHKEEGWLEYSNAGGKNNIKNLIESFLKGFEKLQKKEFEYLRCFVLIDSDKEYPTHIKDEHETLVKYLTEKEIKYHILEKREMENYLPDEAWDDVNAKPEFIEAYKQLDPTQKDFFDIERGFNDKNIKSLNSEVQHLYSSVTEDNYNLLRKGIEMGDSYKSEFPKYFFSENVNQQTLINRTSHQVEASELPNLLEKISSLL